MQVSLTSPFLQFESRMDKNEFNLRSIQEGFPAIRAVQMGVVYRMDGQNYADNLENRQAASRIETIQDPIHGEMQSVTMDFENNQHGLHVVIQFALLMAEPLLLWKITLVNESVRPIFIRKIEMLKIDRKIKASMLRFGNEPQKLSFFSNGWQSWSYSAAYQKNQKARLTGLGFIQKTVIENPGTPHNAGVGKFSSDFFGALAGLETRKGLVLGFLSQAEQFGCVEADIRGEPQVSLWANGDDCRLDPGHSLSTDWAAAGMFNVDDLDPLNPYLVAAARQNRVKVNRQAPLGWCSWYQYYQKITGQQVLDNLEVIKRKSDELPLELVQIDDGFERQIGDWFDFRPTFPQGVKPLAQEIRSRGFTPGLWLAPFIVHPAARLVREHPEYLQRNRSGLPVNAGYNWDVFTTALDLTVPEALDYACKVVSTAAHEWGFPYLKLDFLYAGALAGKHHDPTLTRAQILRKGMEAIRRAAGEETFLLGCGMPLGSGLGIMEAMRIGEDVSGSWKPSYGGLDWVLKREPCVPSAENAIQNTLTRAFFHQRWWINDPDCLLVRPDSRLTLSEIQALATCIAMTGGSLLLSDDLTTVPAERLAIAEALIPPVEQRVKVIDWMDRVTPELLRLDINGPEGKWEVLARFNWKDEPIEVNLTTQDFHLPEKEGWFSSFWDGHCKLISPGKSFSTRMAPHSALLLAWREVDLEKPQLVGSNLHFSQGCEVEAWIEEEHSLEVHLALPRCCQGHLIFSFPNGLESAEQDEKPLPWRELGNGLFRVDLGFNKKTVLRFRW
jgi:alpha-galactosidase